MSRNNPLRAFVQKVNTYPDWLSSRIITWVFRFKVKMVGTMKVEILSNDLKSVVFRQRNIKRAQNHIGGVHAAAMSLLAESATGFVVGVNLPGDKLPLIKSMQLKYVRRSQGALVAKAELTDEQISAMQQSDKGEVNVTVKVTDESGEEPVICEMIWAWVAKK